MKTYAVSVIIFFDNDLQTHIVHALHWREALWFALIQLSDESQELAELRATQHLESLPMDQEMAEREALDQDWSFNVVEIFPNKPQALGRPWTEGPSEI